MIFLMSFDTLLNMRLLIVEDEPTIANFIRQGLSEAGYAVDVACNGEEGLDYSLAAEYDVLILDIMLPKLDGIQLLRRPPLQTGTILQMADLQMDTARHLVERNGRLIELSPREYAVLEYLMRHPNQVLSRTQIGEHVWNFDFYNESNVVDVYVGYLRRKIDQPGEASLIHTVRGVGYCLRDEG